MIQTVEAAQPKIAIAGDLSRQSPPDLLRSIAQVGTIAPADIDHMVQELQPHLLTTDVNYPDFQNGRWKLLALYNASGDPTDTTVRENEATQPTPALRSMPRVQQVIESISPPGNIVLARVARFSPGGRLWEHVDYSELSKDIPRLRYHIPVVTEPGAVFVTAGYRVHMGEGSLWVVNPRGAHGIAHEGQRDRVHIIIDATVDDSLSVEQPWLDSKYVEPLDQAGLHDLHQITRELAKLVIEGNPEAAVERGLNLFYRWRLPESITTHQLLARVFAQAGDSATAQFWLNNNEKFMGGQYAHD
jgi:hypothetical protein